MSLGNLAGAAWAIGEIGDKKAGPILLKVTDDFLNATDTQYGFQVPR